ncbi:hypothetical protein Nepgr_031657 [Nepenthes gracilis]|uniref:Cytochrome P450 n=1 Tax=Nepenthes gracilis TaxID=150966 RepID=A0AAD3TIK0_NEPGR|nr:hypothetical protein Nepgr_031657 [Nepenthes gracilis]
MNLFSCVVCLLLIWLSTHYLLLLLKRTKYSQKQLPPGPFPLPVIGNVLNHIVNPQRSFGEIAKVYGPVMTVQLGYLTTVVISSAAMARQVLQKQDLSFSTRNPWAAVSVLDHHESSVAFLPPDSEWRNLRKICKSFIFSNSRIDASGALRRKVVQQLISHVQNRCAAGSAVNIREAAFTTSLNLISNTFFSSGLADYGGSENQLKDLISAMVAEAGTLSGSDFFPMLKPFDPQGIRRRSTIIMKKIFSIFNSIINERLTSRKASVSSEKNEDVLDSILNISQGNNKEFDLSAIPHLLLDLFVAGTDTTSTTFEWAMAELIKNPEKLEKSRAELERVIGTGNPIEEEDIARLPYLQAVVKETLRLHPAVAFLIPRKVAMDVHISGYTVPKGAQVLVNVWAMGREESVWEDANSFMPERFLESKIDVKGGDFELIPFGAGRRICPGMSLANRMVPYMLGSLIHSFNWKLGDGIKPENMNMDEKFGFTVTKALPLHAIPFHSC